MKPRKVLVTGGAGFIGSHLVRQLVAANHAVRVLEKPGSAVSHLPQDQIEIVFADIRDGAAVARATGDCDVVLHLAANPNLWARNPDDFEQVNHQGTRHVLEAARSAGARRIVHVSTESILAAAYGQEMITEETQTSLSDMIGPYCRSKWLAEQAAQEAVEAGQPVVIVRPTIAVGPGDVNLGPPSRLICDFCNGRVKGHLDGGLNLIDVRDAAAGIWAAAERGEIGRRYLLAAEDWSIRDLLRLLGKLSSRPAPRWRVPYALALAFAHLEEWVCRHFTAAVPMATVTGVRLTQRHFRFDGRQSARELRLEPMRDCGAAVAEALDWFRAAGLITT
ncbi:MAG: NAD-dependent epimerase/dehydratase family protein [Nitrospira sp.]|nr:NAD-dependent epimerase/dehydratase family protein [Nitrospira sp.]